MTIGGTPPPMLGEFTTISKNLKGKTLYQPKKLLQHIHMNIRYGNCITLGGHC